ncbi:MAG: hypothetical protein KBB86_01210 [Candidatus Pacebacteria bacterium]|nr:hypothetical protein [Candidatus Paceibacterota bacterium]
MNNNGLSSNLSDSEKLECIRQDLGKIAKIKYFIHEEGESQTIWNMLNGVEMRVNEILRSLIYTQKVLIFIAIILSLILGTLIFK